MKIIHVDDDKVITPQMQEWFSKYVELAGKDQLNGEDTRANTEDYEFSFEEDKEVENWAKLAKLRKINTQDLEYFCNNSEEEFWTQIESLQQTQSVPDLIILDLKLQKNESIKHPSGLALLEKIRGHATLSLTPVIMLSTYKARDAVQNCYKAGANAYVTKGSFDDLKNKFLAIITHWNSIVLLINR